MRTNIDGIMFPQINPPIDSDNEIIIYITRLSVG